MKKVLSVLLSLCILCTILPAASAADDDVLPCISITLKDGLSLSTINSGSKDTKYGGNQLCLVDADGTVSSYDNVELKGRGNFTWNYCSKKPYQIKFDEKVSVFGMQKAKKWILTANYADVTLLRNKLAYDLAGEIGLLAPDSMFVDLYVNDEYIGNYLLSEKNEVGKGRVELSDDYGVLCEVDGNYGTSEEYYFKTAIKQNVIVLNDSKADDLDKSDSVSLAAFKAFEQKLNSFEALLYSADATWDDIAQLIDVDSFIAYYFLQELCEDSDGCRSSFYIYSDGVDDVIHIGPVWDYDIAFGQFDCEERGGDPQIDYTNNIRQYQGSISVGWFNRLFRHEEFNDLAVDKYNSTIKPAFMNIEQMVADYVNAPGFAASVSMNFEKWTSLLGCRSLYGSNAHAYKSTYGEEVEYMLDWIDTRLQYLNSRYAPGSDYFHSYSAEHVTEHHVGKAPTCTEAGYRAYDTCTCCSYTNYVEIPATGHSYSAVVTNPKCTTQGYTTHTCACGDTYVDSYVDPLGHSFVNGVCTRCSAKQPAATMSILTPSTTTVKYGDTLILHAYVENMPADSHIEWSVSGSGAQITASADGSTCGVKCTGKGTVTVTARLVYNDGTPVTGASGELSADRSLTMDGSVWNKVVSFFKDLFGVNRVTERSR